MDVVVWLNNALIKYWYILGWRHIIEILFFAAVFYYTSLWLKHDKQSNMLPIFYGYCFTIFASYALGLSAISQFLLLFAPVTVMLFIMVHQHTLQKNFVTARNIRPEGDDTKWLDTLTHSMLVAINNNQSMICIIEKNDNLEHLLDAPYMLNSTINHDLLDIVVASKLFEHDKMIWITNTGSLKAINATYGNTIDPTWIEQSLKTAEHWKQDALFIASKSDALIIKAFPLTRTFTIIYDQTVQESITTHEFKFVVQGLLQKQEPEKMRGAYSYEHVEKPISKQPQP